MLAGPQARINGTPLASVRRSLGDSASFMMRSDVANRIDIPYRCGMLGLTTPTTGWGEQLRLYVAKKKGMGLRSQN